MYTGDSSYSPSDIGSLWPRYKPNSGSSNNGNGNGNDSNDCENGNDSQTCQRIPNDDETISDPEFWNSIINNYQNKLCASEDDLASDSDDLEDDVPYIDYGDDESADSDNNLMVVFWRGLDGLGEYYAVAPRELSILPSGFIRELLVSLMPKAPPPTKAPTGELDEYYMKQNDFTTAPMPKFDYQASDGRRLWINNKQAKKVTWGHTHDLDIPDSIGELVYCPLKTGKGFQRTHCYKITDEGRSKMVARILEITTTLDNNHVALKMKMPYKPDQQCYAYVDIPSGHVSYHHLNGKLWSVDRAGANKIATWLCDPKVIKNPSVADDQTYAHFRQQNPQCQSGQNPGNQQNPGN